MDASVARNLGYGAMAAVCRDRGGAYLGASAIVFRVIIDPPTLEALAIWEALAFAKSLNLQMICVASDCKVLVDDIKHRSLASYGVIIHEIIDYSRTFTICNFVHKFMSSNFEVHNLEKHALNLWVGRHVCLGHPGDLLSR